jgi:hypothetical protein
MMSQEQRQALRDAVRIAQGPETPEPPQETSETPERPVENPAAAQDDSGR